MKGHLISGISEITKSVSISWNVLHLSNIFRGEISNLKLILIFT